MGSRTHSISSSSKLKTNQLLDDKLLKFDDPRYRAKQLKKQRRHDIHKRFTDTASISHHSSHSHGHGHHLSLHPSLAPPKVAPPSDAAKSTPAKSAAAKHAPKPKPKRNEYDAPAAHCHMTFIFDPNGRLSYWMSFIVSLAFLYNFWVMIYRFSFNEITSKNKLYWFLFDYFADFLYICDIMFNFRTGFLEEGVLQTDPIRLRHHYMNTTRFYVDCLCLMPLDILYLSLGYNSIFRCFRLVKIYRFWGFLDRTERHTNFPNVFRTVVMLHYLFAIFHWNACFTYYLSQYLSNNIMLKPQGVTSSMNTSANIYLGGLGMAASGLNVRSVNSHHHHGGFNYTSAGPVDLQPFMSIQNELGGLPRTSEDPATLKHAGNRQVEQSDLLINYLMAFYTSTKIMTLVSEMPNPKTSQDYIFAIFQLITALLLFATIMGHVGYIVSNLGNARKEFQSKLDAVKTYMSLRRVPQRLQDRVIRWFDFLWSNHKSTDDNQILNLLPYKLRAEISIHVHLDTLKRVEIFQNTEAGFLNELVLRLKPVLYSPGDFICRKGEVGKEMYIVNGGKLQVISDDGKLVLATLKAGSYFGEISILNMGASGNRRTASVKSVGYSDLFCLSKEDLWEVLKEYPAVRVKLEAIAVRRLEKHKKPLSELVNLSRCKSTPGLVEASIATPFSSAANKDHVNKGLKRYGTLPVNLLKRTDLSWIISSMPNPTGPQATRNRQQTVKNRSKTPRIQQPSRSEEAADNSQSKLVTSMMSTSSPLSVVTTTTLTTPTTSKHSDTATTTMVQNEMSSTLSQALSIINETRTDNASLNNYLRPNNEYLQSENELGSNGMIMTQYVKYEEAVEPENRGQSSLTASHVPSSLALRKRSSNVPAGAKRSSLILDPQNDYLQMIHLKSTPTDENASIFNEVCSLDLNDRSSINFSFNNNNTAAANHNSLMKEIARLRTYVCSLEAEKASLTLRLEKQTWDLKNHLDPIEFDMMMRRATIDDCDDSEEFKV